MKHLVYILLFLSAPLFAQEKAKTWDAQTLAKANTAKNEKYLSKKEKEVIFYMNLVRLNPKLFGETYLKNYLDSTGENSTYTKSLIKQLPKQRSMDVLVPAKDLWELSKAHATKFGKEGKVGHGSYDQRIKTLREKYSGMGENCDYGNERAIDIVMSLLIDEDVKSLGHRANILRVAYKYVGTSIQPHKTYNWNCVMDFGG